MPVALAVESLWVEGRLRTGRSVVRGKRGWGRFFRVRVTVANPEPRTYVHRLGAPAFTGFHNIRSDTHVRGVCGTGQMEMMRGGNLAAKVFPAILNAQSAAG